MINRNEIEALKEYLNENTEDSPRIARSFLEDFIPALEKQIPKKIIRQKEELTDEEAEELVDLGFCGGDVIRCPNCNEYIVVDKLKYCMECGQALDWSKT